MKTQSLKLLLSAVIIVLVAWVVASCSKDDNSGTTAVVKTALETAIDTANHYLTATTEGTAAGEYTEGSKTTLQTAVTTAVSIESSTTSTQAQVDGATTALNAAIAVYKGQIIAEVDPADLIAYWKFDEGSGTSIADQSGNAHVGTLMPAPAQTTYIKYAGGVPTWVADRSGTAAKALHFTDGGHIEFPASSSFVPSTGLTISCWVNVDTLYTGNGINNDNYILAQNSYNVYKFQTQDARKPFLTIHYADGQYYNEDTGDGNANVKSTLYTGRWYHVAATFDGAGVMSFYINGILARTITHDDSKGNILASGNLDKFVVGIDEPNEWYANAANNVNYTPTARFEGSIDDVRMYSKALTASQVTSIYNQEKP